MIPRPCKRCGKPLAKHSVGQRKYHRGCKRARDIERARAATVRRRAEADVVIDLPAHAIAATLQQAEAHVKATKPFQIDPWQQVGSMEWDR